SLANIAAADLRAFLADRRAGGLGAASAARELSGVRAFLRYAAEQQGTPAQLPRTRAPKRPRTLPRPAAPDEAMELAENAAEAARYADAACAATQLCDASAGARCGPEGATGTARPCEPVVDPDLHGGGRGAPARRLPPRPPPRLSRGPGAARTRGFWERET